MPKQIGGSLTSGTSLVLYLCDGLADERRGLTRVQPWYRVGALYPHCSPDQ